MMKALSTVLSAWFLSACLYLSHAKVTGISIQTVEASLREGNPSSTLEKYFNCEQYDGSAYEEIASGSFEWISLAEKILQYSDGCYTEGIQTSLGRAMQKSPQDVLSLVDRTSTLAASYICLPYISNEISTKPQLAEVIRLKKAILRVHDQRLKTQKESCLRFIKSVEASLITQQLSSPENQNAIQGDAHREAARRSLTLR